MADNALNILIKASLDRTSKKTIEDQLTRLNIDPIEIKVNSEALNILSRFSTEMKNIANTVGVTNLNLKKQIQYVKDENNEWAKRTRIFSDGGFVEVFDKVSQKQKEALDNATKTAQVLNQEKGIVESTLGVEKESVALENKKTNAIKEQVALKGRLYKSVINYNADDEANLRRHYYDQGDSQTIATRTGKGKLLGYKVVNKEDLTISQQQNKNYAKAQILLREIARLRKEIAKSEKVDAKITEERQRKLTKYTGELGNLTRQKIDLDKGTKVSAIGEENLEKVKIARQKIDSDIEAIHRSKQEKMTKTEMTENQNRIELVEKYKTNTIKAIDEMIAKNKLYLNESDIGKLEKQKSNISGIDAQNKDINTKSLEKYTTELNNVQKEIDETITAQKRLNSMGMNIRDTITDKTLFQPENKKQLQDYLTTVFGANTQIKGLQTTIDRTGQEVIKFDRVVKTGKDTFEVYKTAIDKTTGTIRDNGSITKDVLNRNIGLWKTFTVAMQRIPVWFAGMTVYMQAIRFLSNGVKYIVEMDNAMNQVRIVTGKSADEAIRLGKEYNKLAREMSVSTSEIAKASVEFARQGLPQDEINKRLQETIKYAKISSLEFTEASEIMTATVNSMKIDIERASDVFSYLGETFVAPLYSNI